MRNRLFLFVFLLYYVGDDGVIVINEEVKEGSRTVTSGFFLLTAVLLFYDLLQK